MHFINNDMLGDSYYWRSQLHIPKIEVFNSNNTDLSVAGVCQVRDSFDLDHVKVHDRSVDILSKLLFQLRLDTEYVHCSSLGEEVLVVV